MKAPTARKASSVSPVVKGPALAESPQHKFYRQIRFKEIGPYRPNPIASAMHMELEL
jgi:hypothetical protein